MTSAQTLTRRLFTAALGIDAPSAGSSARRSSPTLPSENHPSRRNCIRPCNKWPIPKKLYSSRGKTIRPAEIAFIPATNSPSPRNFTHPAEKPSVPPKLHPSLRQTAHPQETLLIPKKNRPSRGRTILPCKRDTTTAALGVAQGSPHLPGTFGGFHTCILSEITPSYAPRNTHHTPPASQGVIRRLSLLIEEGQGMARPSLSI